MDQVKIGKFIADCRKRKNLTQMQLAEKLNITDRAISKWETGKGMPDSSIMLELCNELEISVNELLSGEMINVKEFNKKANENLIKLQKQKESAVSAARWTHVFITVILLILTFINVYKYGVEQAITKIEFRMMIISSLIYFTIYIFLTNQNSKV